MSIELEFINSISPSLTHFVNKKSSFKFQCPYCQVGRRSSGGKTFSPSEASGHLYEASHGWNFKCHREKHCGRSTSFARFLEDNFPSEFLKYVRRREAIGTTGYQTNCPNVETVLKRRGSMPTHPPKFHDPSRTQEPSQDTPEVFSTPIQEAETPQMIIKLPAMRSPSQQSGHQAKLNRKVKEYRQRRHLEPGDAYL